MTEAKFEVVNFPATILIGLEADFYGGMSPKFNGQEVLGPLWQQVFAKLGELGIAYQGQMIAATRPAASGEEGLLTQFVGQVVQEVPAELAGLDVYQLQAMRLATFEHHGSMHGLVASIKKLYNEILPQSGLEQPTPWAIELEIYDEHFDPSRPDSVMLIGTPVI